MRNDTRKVMARLVKKIYVPPRVYREISRTLSRTEERLRLLDDWYKCFQEDNPPSYSIIVFSKDRPMQLHALLSSYMEAALLPSKVYILYCASTPEFRAGYGQCIQIFESTSSFDFIQQQSGKSFRSDLLQILKRCTSTRIVYLVDDIVFIRDFNIRDLDNLDLRMNVPSLRLGKNIVYSYTTQTKQSLPRFIASTEKFLFWNWQGNSIDWSYPLSVDGNVYLRSEMMALLNAMDFSTPNSLEAGFQNYLDLYIKRRGVCYEFPRIVNIPCNRVQNDFKNLHGEVSAEFLLEKWMDGYQMNHAELRELEANSAHVDLKFNLIKRTV